MTCAHSHRRPVRIRDHLASDPHRRPIQLRRPIQIGDRPASARSRPADRPADQPTARVTDRRDHQHHSAWTAGTCYTQRRRERRRARGLRSCAHRRGPVGRVAGRPGLQGGRRHGGRRRRRLRGGIARRSAALDAVCRRGRAKFGPRSAKFGRRPRVLSWRICSR